MSHLNHRALFLRSLAIATVVVCLGSIPWRVLAASITNTGTASFKIGSAVQSIPSNTVTINSIPPPTPAVIQFYQYVSGSSTIPPIATDGGLCQTSPGVFAPLPPATDLSGHPINAAAVTIQSTRVYHGGEAVFLTVADANRNLDPTVRDVVELRLTTDTGDEEILRLQETGPNTGVFATSIQTVPIPPQATPFDCRLSVKEASTIYANYTDTYYPTDTVEADVLIDPFGIVFNSSNGVPVNAASVTLINTLTGQPAQVFGDDGVSTFPATLVSGTGASDSSGKSYVFPPGGFRFPFVLSGTYRLVITPPGGYTAPSTVSLSTLTRLVDSNGNPYSVIGGSFGDVFTLLPGPALKIDIPVDPLKNNLLLEKSVSNSTASAGDFLRYHLTLTNLDTAAAASNAAITDTLPIGMRYQHGSLRVRGQPAPEPAMSRDGRTLTFPVGTLAAGESVEVSYVVLIGAGAIPGQAVNRAHATADGGITSNEARSAVQIREAFFRDGFTIEGRVLEGDCGTPWSELKGVPNVRLLMEDGTYIITDADGQYHFEGVRPGTHVVQLDLDSLPANLEPISCIQNSRFAGRSFSQFVEAQGGTLWRADFYVKPKAPQEGSVGIRLQSTLTPEQQQGSPIARQYTFHALFETLSTRLPADKEMVLDMLVAELRNIEIERIEVIGHTDNVRIAPSHRDEFPDNYALSQARASVVADYLRQMLRLDPHQVNAVGHGPDVPVADNRTEAGRAENRRVELVVYGRETAHESVTTGSKFRYRVNVNGGTVPVQNLRISIMLPEGITYSPGTSTLDGKAFSDPSVTANIATYSLGDVGADWKHVIEFSGRTPEITTEPAKIEPMVCPTGGFPAKALTLFDTDLEKNIRTTPVETVLPCPMPRILDHDQHRVVPPTTSAQTLPDHSEEVLSGTSQADSGQRTETVLGRPPGKMTPVSVYEVNRGKREAIPDDVTAAGGNTDWLAGRTPGVEWLFPPPDHNPRAPTVRVVIKHAADQTVVLKQEGVAVDPRSFDGAQTDAAGTFTVSVWRGLPLKEGDNSLEAEILDRNGAVAQTLSRVVHYANQPVRAEIVPDESILVADGIHKPVIAVRLFDRYNRPVRSGVTGGFEVNPPYVPAIRTEEEQQRQLAGLDRFRPHFRIEGDQGVAYIELSPTTVTGLVLLNFDFPDDQDHRRQELRAWLEAEPRDWVVVGFAEGTVGYETLKGNMQALEAHGHEEGVSTDGQVRLYAKGRVLGQWLLTLAYDSDKPQGQPGRESLFSTIDPNRFYTLYGDGSQQRYDAASRDKLYLKMERRQFYALFGDYETGLTQTQLSRYNRSLTGFKTEYHGDDFNFTGYAAETDLNFARDEIQGNGTSGLYHLSHGSIVINSEKIRIETRDRLQSERILQSRSLLPYLDYDIDYDAGTIFFRQPINSRDENFNPNFIVAEYETFGSVEKTWNAGGRLGTQVWAGRLSAGLTYLRDANNLDKTDLGGMDLNLKLGTETQLRFELARTDGQTGNVNHEGSAHLIELEHHDGRFDTLVYTRRQEAAFGLNQQNASETGTVKTGLDGWLRLTDRLSLQGQVYRQDYLLSDASRDAGNAELAYRTEMGGFHGGTQMAMDTATNGDRLESRQATLGANRFLLDKKLELQTQAEIGLAGKNDSTDFPDRYELSAAYSLTEDVRLIVAQEFTHGNSFDSSTTRVGLQAVPWKGARLTSTLNQNQINENGPRTFGQLGLTQAFLVGERWGFDLSADSTRTLHQSGTPPLILNPNHPVASGGVLGDGSWTEDFVAFSGGATYRSDVWSWNGRAETRQGETTDRYSLTTGFLRQASAGIAFSLSGQAFQTKQESGPKGQLANLGMSWAFRPLASRWSILEKLEFKYEELTHGTGVSGSGLFGNTSLTVDGDARSRRIVNNIVFNRVSQAWTEADRQGNLFELSQRHQWSFYYGAKYVLDRFDDRDYIGYTDLAGLEWRFDLTRQIDLGLRMGLLHAWTAHNFDFTVGPMIGISPFENAWITLGYNVIGFRDRDFGAANYTAQGLYLQLRIKFDQLTGRPGSQSHSQGRDSSDVPSTAQVGGAQ